MTEFLHSIPIILVPIACVFLAGVIWAARAYERFNTFYEKNYDLKTDTKEEIATLRIETKEDIAALRTDTKEDIAALRKETKEDIAALRTETKEGMTAMGQRMDTMEERMDTMEKKMDVMGEKMDVMGEKIEKIIGFFNVPSVLDPSSETESNSHSAKNSPRMLTKKGEALAKEVDAYRLADKYYGSFAKEIDKRKPITKLEVENISFVLVCPFEYNVATIFDRADYKKISDTVYDSVRIVSTVHVSQVFSILIRDRYLKNHPEL